MIIDLSTLEDRVEEMPFHQRLIGRPMIATAKFMSDLELYRMALCASAESDMWSNPLTVINHAAAAVFFEDLKTETHLKMLNLRSVVMSQAGIFERSMLDTFG